MRKAMLWGAAVALAFASTAGVANVVVVKSLGPSAKSYPPGKTLPETAKISLQGGDVVTVLGPASAQTLRGPGNFDAKQVALASAAGQRGRFGALRAIEVAHNPTIWDIDVNAGGKVCVADQAKLQLWRGDSEAPAMSQNRWMSTIIALSRTTLSTASRPGSPIRMVVPANTAAMAR